MSLHCFRNVWFVASECPNICDTISKLSPGPNPQRKRNCLQQHFCRCDGMVKLVPSPPWHLVQPFLVDLLASPNIYIGCEGIRRFSVATPPDFETLFRWFGRNILAKTTFTSKTNQLLINTEISTWDEEFWQLCNKHSLNISECCKFVILLPILPSCFVIKSHVLHDLSTSRSCHRCDKSTSSFTF